MVCKILYLMDENWSLLWLQHPKNINLPKIAHVSEKYFSLKTCAIKIEKFFPFPVVLYNSYFVIIQSWILDIEEVTFRFHNFYFKISEIQSQLYDKYNDNLLIARENDYFPIIKNFIVLIPFNQNWILFWNNFLLN